jgi:hypothetical protein
VAAASSRLALVQISDPLYLFEDSRFGRRGSDRFAIISGGAFAISDKYVIKFSRACSFPPPFKLTVVPQRGVTLRLW